MSTINSNDIIAILKELGLQDQYTVKATTNGNFHVSMNQDHFTAFGGDRDRGDHKRTMEFIGIGKAIEAKYGDGTWTYSATRYDARQKQRVIAPCLFIGTAELGSRESAETKELRNQVADLTKVVTRLVELQSPKVEAKPAAEPKADDDDVAF